MSTTTTSIALSRLFTRLQLKLALTKAEEARTSDRHRIAIVEKGSACHRLLQDIWVQNSNDPTLTAVTYPQNIAVMQLGSHLIEVTPEAGSGKFVRILSFTKM